MRELIASTKMAKPLIALIDPDASHGGMTVHEVHAQLLEAEECYGQWGLIPTAPAAAPKLSASKTSASTSGFFKNAATTLAHALPMLPIHHSTSLVSLAPTGSAPACDTSAPASEAAHEGSAPTNGRAWPSDQAAPGGQALYEHLMLHEPIEVREQ
jgi:hypothetical protein